MLSDLHRRCLSELTGDSFELVELAPHPVGVRDAILGRVDGVTAEVEREFGERLGAGAIERVILNGSNLGRLARVAKQASPSTELWTIFHNVEASFFRGALLDRPSVHALGVLMANFVAERMAARSSDRRIALSARDGRLLKRLYGRGATDLLPMALDDRFTGADAVAPDAPAGPYLLFVGGGFYANRSGIRWFAREVAPSIALPTIVVGHGLDDLRDELERGGTVRLIGSVDRLEPWYRGASAVIAPIFDGSGMKTKVAEALMFGKRVIGTPEAFSGYEEVAARAGTICGTASEFIAAIEAIAPAPAVDPGLRLLFERYYSLEATRDRLAAMLSNAPSHSAR